ncbi:MAG: N-acetylglutamate kinase [Bryobacterales bacterium]|nr:N-acetylglutamate kinase [Bryobacterales bacterium]
MKPRKLLIKLGGTLLDAPDSRQRLAREIAAAAAEPSLRIVVVHGGGKQMTRFLAERGIESRFVNGLRVTTPEIIDAVLKVFAGSVNAELVAAFRAAGARPVGLSGLDAGLVDAELLNPDLGQVGKPIRSDARLLDLLTGDTYLPVVACVAGDARGNVYNVNADQMAVACAASFAAESLVFLTDVKGVLDRNGAICPTLTCNQARTLIQEGVATGGMQAKLEAATDALGKGVGQVLIAPGALAGVVGQLLAGQAVGTRLIL